MPSSCTRHTLGWSIRLAMRASSHSTLAASAPCCFVSFSATRRFLGAFGSRAAQTSPIPPSPRQTRSPYWSTKRKDESDERLLLTRVPELLELSFSARRAAAGPAPRASATAPAPPARTPFPASRPFPAPPLRAGVPPARFPAGVPAGRRRGEELSLIGETRAPVGGVLFGVRVPSYARRTRAAKRRFVSAR